MRKHYFITILLGVSLFVPLCIQGQVVGIDTLNIIESATPQLSSFRGFNLKESKIVRFSPTGVELVEPNIPEGLAARKQLYAEPANQYGFFFVDSYIFSETKNSAVMFETGIDTEQLAILVKDTNIIREEDLEDKALLKQKIQSALKKGALSADGSTIAVIKNLECGTGPTRLENIYLYRLQTGNLTEALSESPAIWGIMPQWSPGGKYIAFYGGAPETFPLIAGNMLEEGKQGYSLFLLDIDKQGLKALTQVRQFTL